MARVKMLAGRMMSAAAWATIGVATLAAAYEASALAAHGAALLPWR